MLPQARAEKILTLRAAGWSVQAIADQLGHSPQTVRDYVNGRRKPGVRAPRPSLLTAQLADYCRQRFSEDPHLRPIILFNEVAELGFRGSRATFYRELQQFTKPGEPSSHPHQDSLADLAGRLRPRVQAAEHAPVLPRPVAPISGETLSSYLPRLAQANHLTLTEVC